MTIVIPSLSTKGYIENAEEQLDKQLAYYLSTNPSQTLLYNGTVVSLQYAIFRAAGDIDRLCSIVNNDLNAVFGRLFPDGVTVDVSYTTENNSSRVNLQIAMSVIKGNRKYDLARAINGVDSVFVGSQKATRLVNL